QSEHVQDSIIADALVTHTNWSSEKSKPYVVKCNESLMKRLSSEKTITGFTATNVGFYGPQGRVLRLPIHDNELNEKLANFNYNGMAITNLEMETAGIYGLSILLGHRALSMNAIIANRATGEFTSRPKEIVDELIQYTLEKLIN